MKRYFYLIKIQFLGFRFSGWQKQSNAKTVQEMVDRTVCFVVGHENHKTLGAGRTDAKVSANEYAFELFIYEQLDIEVFLKLFNENLPPDIRALSIAEVDDQFNIIKSPKYKEYFYLFTYGQRPHPFSASLMVYFENVLDIQLMQAGALTFKGEHNFQDFCYKPTSNTSVIRTIKFCEIIKNDVYKANFFPEDSWILKVQAKGFLRHQIRMMMGGLVKLGRGEISLLDLENSLKGEREQEVNFIAPSSGLLLHKLEIE